MKPAHSTQLRIRLTEEAAKRFASLPRVARMRAVSMILDAEAEGIDLRELLALRITLVNLGTLLNQSLKTSWGQDTDAQAANEVVGLIKRLVG